jgi:hypothetical protein
VLVVAACVKCAFGVPSGSSTLDTHHHDQGRPQLRPEPLTGLDTIHVDTFNQRGRVGLLCAHLNGSNSPDRGPDLGIEDME